VVLPTRGVGPVDDALRRAAPTGVPTVSWRGPLGHAGLADDVVDVALAARGLRDGAVPGLGTDGAVLVLAIGLQGEAAAVLLAPAPSPSRA